MKMSDKMYNILKWVCIILLPALAFGYAQLSEIWGNLPYAEQIPKTINLVATIIGILIGVSTYNYKQENNIIVKKKVEVEEESPDGV